eukprot:COSAG02_NODE_1395_length_12901_cov_16.951726_9_plen_85_part_00
MSAAGRSRELEDYSWQIPNLRVIPCPCPRLFPHHPGYVELYYDPPPPPKPMPDRKTLCRQCEAAALQRRKRRMLAPWVTVYSPP